MTGPCELCGRATSLTRHHLVPQCRHRNKWNKKNFDRQTVKHSLLMTCSSCHKQLHAVFTEKELERRFHDPASLRDHPEIAKFIAWIRNKPPGFKAIVNKMRTA